jgi:hypothetical protein
LDRSVVPFQAAVAAHRQLPPLLSLLAKEQRGKPKKRKEFDIIIIVIQKCHKTHYKLQPTERKITIAFCQNWFMLYFVSFTRIWQP